MRLPKAIRNLTIPLPETRATVSLRDQTRVTRARLAELTLKMHARPQDHRVSEPLFSPRSEQDNEAG